LLWQKNTLARAVFFVTPFAGKDKIAAAGTIGLIAFLANLGTWET